MLSAALKKQNTLKVNTIEEKERSSSQYVSIHDVDD